MMYCIIFFFVNIVYVLIFCKIIEWYILDIVINYTILISV
jgi:hypothetical protein